MLDASAVGIVVGGNGASGSMNVNSGGTVLAGTSFTVGTAVDISGTVYGGSGVADIGPNGTVEITEAPQTSSYAVEIGTANSNVGGPTPLSNGAVSVSGAGALLDSNDNGLEVGRLGTGSLAISQGGTVVTGTSNSADLAAAMLGNRGGDGSVTVADTGSDLTSDGFFGVGREGTGNLVVENHGTCWSAWTVLAAAVSRSARVAPPPRRPSMPAAVDRR